MKTTKLLTFICALFSLSASQATIVRLETNLGDIDVELYEDDAPVTTANFLGYVNRGDYDDTIFHRLNLFQGISVIQGGGYRYNGSTFTAVDTQSPIINEADILNTTGTISMARDASPNTARNQFFFNLTDNPGLDPSASSDGYAVFGEIVRGLDVLQNMGSSARYSFSTNIGTLNELPLFQFYGGRLEVDNTIKINRAFVLSDNFQINAGLSGAWFTPATSGQGIYIEALPDAGQLIMAWFTFDTELPDAMTPSEVGFAGNRWLVAIGDFTENEFNGTVYQTSNGKFDDPASVDNTAVGTVSMTFNSCSELIMNYSLYNGSLNGMNTLVRISGSNIALCEQLAAEANQGVAQ